MRKMKVLGFFCFVFFLFPPFPNKALVHPHLTSSIPVTLHFDPLRPGVHVEEEAPSSPAVPSVWVSQSNQKRGSEIECIFVLQVLGSFMAICHE